MDEEFLDFEEKFVLRKAKKQKPSPFTPETFTPESLITNRIATASSTRTGNQATIQAALARFSRRDNTSFAYDADLARRVAQGSLVRFKDTDEKARILALTEEHAMETTAKRNRDKLKRSKNDDKIEFESPLPIRFETVPAKKRREIVDKVLRGKYEYEGKSGKQFKDETVSELKRALDWNGTYKSGEWSGFLGLFKRLLPQTAKR
jgi:hypothetical protein